MENKILQSGRIATGRGRLRRDRRVVVLSILSLKLTVFTFKISITNRLKPDSTGK